jgi:predicted ribosome quality control (RQC) complex YloA/Tae2 family protein
MERKLSSFDIYVITNELQELIGSFIDKIYQPTRDELTIRVNNSRTKQKETIFIRNGELICLTKRQIEAPTKPTNFSMVLRKYLLNGKIAGIAQHEFDRIIKLEIGKKEGNYILIIEFFSDGNMILVDPDGKIASPLISQHWSHRTIKTHEKYVPPPNQIDPFKINFEKFVEILKNSKADLVRTLAVNVNLSGTYAEEICKRANIDKNFKAKDLDEKDTKKVFTELTKILEIFNNKNFKPVLVKKDEKISDVLPFEFDSYSNMNFENTDNFTRALENFIDTKKEGKHEIGEKERRFEKLHRQLLQQQESVVDLEKRIKEKKLEGDLIYLNFPQCEALLKEIAQIMGRKEKDEKIQQINKKEIVKEFDPLSNKLVVLLHDTNDSCFEVNLDFRINTTDNAKKKYDESKKLKNKLSGALDSIEKTKKMIESTEKHSFVEKKKEKNGRSEKRFWFENFRWFISSEGNVVVGGRDAGSNDKIVKKYLKEGDRYAHADIHGAPSCIIKSKDANDNNISISDKTLEEACIFASVYSKAWKQFAEAQAYWVLPEQVSKTPQSGEFLPKGAFVIRGKRNYHRCKLEMAVGGIEIDGTKKIMGGPIGAFEKRSERYIVLTPGNMKKSEIVSKLSRAFDVSTDTIEKVLPPGDLNVVKIVGFKFD